MPQNDLLVRRSASLTPGSFNRAAGTVDAILSTGAAVRRPGFTEALDVTAGAVEVSANIPVLDSHKQDSIASVLGRVVNVRFESGRIIATLRITSPAALDAIERGDITGVSIGYTVQRWAEARDQGTGERTRTASRWTILEVSLVPLPADPGSIFRNAIVTTENITTTDTTTTTTTEPTTTAAPATRAAINTAIRSIATSAGLDAAWSDPLIDGGTATVIEARAAALDAILARSGGVIRTQVVQAGPSHDDPAVVQTRMVEALAARIMPSLTPSAAARPFMGMGVVDMARHQLQTRGERVSMLSREEVITRAHTTSDFPNLLNATGNRVLAAAYAAAPNPLKLLARQATLADFRAKSGLRLSDLPKLQKVAEHGEIRSVTRTESVETYALETYAHIFSLTRKALINDDLGAFADYAVASGRAAAETESDALVQLLLQGAGLGPLMGDTKRLFSVEHGNLAAVGAAPSVASLTAARIALRNQTGQAGNPINATPRYLLVGSALETVGDQLVAAIYASTASDANPFTGRLTVMVEARLPGNAWFLFADPAVLPVLEYAHLSSAPGPQISSRPGWDVLGIEFRCVLDFGCGAVDWRGAYRNAGA